MPSICILWRNINILGFSLGNDFNIGLKHAIIASNKDIIDYLIQLGGEINVGLTYASYYSNKEIMTYLAGKGGDINLVLMRAIDQANIKSVRYLIDLGVSNLREALAFAIQRGQTYIVEYLTSIISE